MPKTFKPSMLKILQNRGKVDTNRNNESFMSTLDPDRK